MSDKIANIINGVSPVAHIFNENNLLKDLLKILIPLFKTGRYFDIDKILENRELLSYLLAFDSEMRFKELFDSTYNDLSLSKYDIYGVYYDYNLNFYFTCLELKDELSLKTLCWFIDLNLKMKEKIQILSFYKIYKLYEKTKKNENIYEIPEGIIEINRYDIHDDLILKIIRKDMENKTLVIPSTMKGVYEFWFKDINIKGLMLKEGVEFIFSLNSSNLENIMIPSTLAPYCIDFNNLSKLKTIGFTNFQNSECLDRLLNKSNDVSYHNLLSLFKMQLNKDLEIQIIPIFDQMLLYDNKNTEYVINSKDLIIDIGRNIFNEDIPFTDIDLLLKNGFIYLNRYEYIEIDSLLKTSCLEIYEDENISRIFLKKKEEMFKIIQEHILRVIEEKTGVNFKEYNKEKCLKKEKIT